MRELLNEFGVDFAHAADECDDRFDYLDKVQRRAIIFSSQVRSSVRPGSHGDVVGGSLVVITPKATITPKQPQELRNLRPTRVTRRGGTKGDRAANARRRDQKAVGTIN